MNKNIAIICNYDLRPNRIGGMDRFFVKFDKILKEKEYKVDWFFTNYQPFDFYKELIIYSAGSTSVEQNFLTVSKQNKKKYNIIITHFTELCTSYYKEFKENNSTPYIIAVDHNPRPFKGVTIKKRVKNKVKGLLYGKYIDQFVGVSKYTSDYILKDYGIHLKKKIKTIYNGIETTICKKQYIDRNKEPFNFIVVSHLRKSKGIQDLLEALNLFSPEQKSKIKIDIYGEGPYEAYLKKLQISFGLEKNVSFKGSSANILGLLKNYHYLIQPTYMECFSLSILESLASNVPVITTTVGGNLEVVKDGKNGYIFRPKDVTMLADILSKILKGKLTIKNEVYSKIENEFTLNRMVQNHLKLLPCI